MPPREVAGILPKRALVNGLLALASVTAALIVVEGATRALDFFSPPPARSWFEFRLRRPPPYQHAPYDVAELIAEARTIRWRTGSDFGWLPEDREGRYINIRDHRRLTIGGSAGRHIWMFGGSTVMSVEVPDAETPPSVVQRLADEAGWPVKVENLGATTVTIQHQLFRLLSMTPVAAGDIVVFYDGVNDIAQSLYYQNPAGNMVEENRKVLARLSLPQRIAFSINARFGASSAFVRRFIDPTGPARREIDLPPSLLAALEDGYYRAIVEAAAFAAAQGAQFFHFIQPSMYTVSRLSTYEQSLTENAWLYPIELRQVNAAGYPALRRASHRANALGIVSIDLSDAFDARREEIFLDYCHVTGPGNEIIGRAVYAALRQTAPREAEH
jgi:hypothetical protein